MEFFDGSYRTAKKMQSIVSSRDLSVFAAGASNIHVPACSSSVEHPSPTIFDVPRELRGSLNKQDVDEKARVGNCIQKFNEKLNLI